MNSTRECLGAYTCAISLLTLSTWSLCLQQPRMSPLSQLGYTLHGRLPAYPCRKPKHVLCHQPPEIEFTIPQSMGQYDAAAYSQDSPLFPCSIIYVSHSTILAGVPFPGGWCKMLYNLGSKRLSKGRSGGSQPAGHRLPLLHRHKVMSREKSFSPSCPHSQG